jgi:phosphoglucan,water dikinase
LRFLGTSQIRCVEDGRHFRPGNHARLAQQIQGRLGEVANPENSFILRRIYPWLPSSSQTFQRAEPLTRIRDIAHRNDIPGELKREIKTSLQNKLHRCAGPEDLVTSLALLERITAPGTHYPEAFVAQFRIFHEELKEFFNASSVEARLKALPLQTGGDGANLVHTFFEQRKDGGITGQLVLLSTLTHLRTWLNKQLRKAPGPVAQDFILADIGLEDFAFVLSSELLNSLERASAVKEPNQRAAPWLRCLGVLRMLTANLALSNIQPEECEAIGSELQAWAKQFDPAARDELLRLKATVERSRRLAEDYSGWIIELFAPCAEKLGRALGLAEHAVGVFCEADLRSHLVFQLSKLASSLLHRLRTELKLPPWDVLVPGSGTGRIRSLARLEESEGRERDPEILLLERAAGDEEIPTGSAGIVLAHELPHLSHLAVRARQAGIVLVACEDPATFSQAASLRDQIITLSASERGVSWTPARATQRRQQCCVHCYFDQAPAQVRQSAERMWMTLEEVTPETGGAKADCVRRLAQLARDGRGGFKTPASLVIPFGVMEAALRASPKAEAEYLKLVREPAHPDIRRLQELLEGVQIPERSVAEFTARFGRDAALIVRSSANIEDLPGQAGAGLYDSVPGVSPANVTSAIKRVWASLWTSRAVASRQQAGIAHDRAHMAVLIQQMLAPELSFVLHTSNPISRNASEVYVEVAVGLGETLVSGSTRGTPYRLVCDKRSGAVRVAAFASFSQALFPSGGGGVKREIVDYSQVPLTRDARTRQELGGRLGAIGAWVEEALKQPQDIEGAVMNGEIYLVQSRPQQGV